MIIAIDIETYVRKNGKYEPELNAQQFHQGCIALENGKTILCNSKEEMWNTIKYLGIKEHKRQKNLHVYAHNLQYDFYGIADLTDPKIHIKSDNPFIVNYTPNIKFIDSVGIYPMKLQRVGKLIKNEKGELPTHATAQEIETYLKQDTLLLLDALKYMKNKLKDENVILKNVITLNQIAMGYTQKEFRKTPKPYLYYQDVTKEGKHVQRKIIHTLYDDFYGIADPHRS